MSPEHVTSGDTALLPIVGTRNDTARPVSVIVIAHDGATACYRIDRPLIVGRDQDADISLRDQATSRKHARLTPTNGHVEVTDLKSRNGTFVDGAAVQHSVCKAGSLVRIGSFSLLIVCLDEVWQAADPQGPLVGGSALAPIRRTLGLVGPTTLPVLILGETGTGKEVVARSLHDLSECPGPFIAVNCAALPEHLVESEMFGHVRGAFTGGSRDKRGLLSLADGGTLFLDEVGDLPLPAQAKLLRVLEDGVVRPVGSEKYRKVNVRFLSATNSDLASAIAQGGFRRDLYARLAAVELRLPPVRQRREDLLAIMSFLLRRTGESPLLLTADALEALLLHRWPNNVRELDSLVRLMALQGTAIGLEQLPPHLQSQLREARRRNKPQQSAIVTDLEENLIRAMKQNAGNVRQTALAMGVGRGQLYRLLKRFSLDPATYRSNGTQRAKDPDTPTTD